jgi:cob(I)alamin adenosyltransferase
MSMKNKKNLGLIIVHTGAGEGKTAAAMGMALRGAGHGLKTLMIQFIKGPLHDCKMRAAQKLEPHFKILPMGRDPETPEKTGPDPEDVRATWDLFREQMISGEFQMIILDEINGVIDSGLLPVDEVMEVISARPEGLRLVLTGGNAHPRLVEMADLVTEMKEIKPSTKKAGRHAGE